MTPQKYICCQPEEKIGIILIHSHWTAIVLSFFIRQSKGKEISAHDYSQVLCVLKILVAYQLKFPGL